jgi:hypothetical protein
MTTWFKPKKTPKELAKEAKRETKREVRVSVFVFVFVVRRRILLSSFFPIQTSTVQYLILSSYVILQTTIVLLAFSIITIISI